MKAFILTALLTLAPNVVRSTACNADNVLRALRANSAKASPFCSTYTRPPPNQPLPTYVSQYPASRVSSGCSCLITTTSSTTTTLKTSTTSTTTTTSTTSSTPSPTNPPDYVCEGEVLRNGNFQTLVNGKPEPWIFSPETHNNGQSTYAGTGSAGGNTYAYLSVDNGSPGGPGRPYFKQTIPGLCGNTYTLNYTSSLFIRDGQPYHFCRAFIDLDDQQLVFIGGPNGDIPPWQTETRSYTFTYTGGTAPPNTLTVSFDCATASYGSYTIDDISLVGAGEGN